MQDPYLATSLSEEDFTLIASRRDFGGELRGVKSEDLTAFIQRSFSAPRIYFAQMALLNLLKIDSEAFAIFLRNIGEENDCEILIEILKTDILQNTKKDFTLKKFIDYAREYAPIIYSELQRQLAEFNRTDLPVTIVAPSTFEANAMVIPKDVVDSEGFSVVNILIYNARKREFSYISLSQFSQVIFYEYALRKAFDEGVFFEEMFNDALLKEFIFANPADSKRLQSDMFKYYRDVESIENSPERMAIVLLYEELMRCEEGIKIAEYNLGSKIILNFLFYKYDASEIQLLYILDKKLIFAMTADAEQRARKGLLSIIQTKEHDDSDEYNVEVKISDPFAFIFRHLKDFRNLIEYHENNLNKIRSKHLPSASLEDSFRFISLVSFYMDYPALLNSIGYCRNFIRGSKNIKDFEVEVDKAIDYFTDIKYVGDKSNKEKFSKALRRGIFQIVDLIDANLVPRTMLSDMDSNMILRLVGDMITFYDKGEYFLHATTEYKLPTTALAEYALITSWLLDDESWIDSFRAKGINPYSDFKSGDFIPLPPKAIGEDVDMESFFSVGECSIVRSSSNKKVLINVEREEVWNGGINVFSNIVRCLPDSQLLFRADKCFIELLEPERLFFVTDKRHNQHRVTSILKIIEDIVGNYSVASFVLNGIRISEDPKVHHIDIGRVTAKIISNLHCQSQERQRYIEKLFSADFVSEFLEKKLKKYSCDRSDNSISAFFLNADHELEAKFLFQNLKNLIKNYFQITIPGDFESKARIFLTIDSSEDIVLGDIKSVNKWFFEWAKDKINILKYFKFSEDGNFIIKKCDPALYERDLALLQAIAEEYNRKERSKEAAKEEAFAERRFKEAQAEDARRKELKRQEDLAKRKAKEDVEKQKLAAAKVVEESKAWAKKNQKEILVDITKKFGELRCQIRGDEITLNPGLIKKLKEEKFDFLNLPSKGAKTKLSKIDLKNPAEIDRFLTFEYEVKIAANKPFDLREEFSQLFEPFEPDANDDFVEDELWKIDEDFAAAHDIAPSPPPVVKFTPLPEEPRTSTLITALEKCLKNPLDTRVKAVQRNLGFLISKLIECGNLFLQGSALYKDNPKDIDLQLDLSPEMEETLLGEASREHFLKWFAENFLGDADLSSVLSLNLIYSREKLHDGTKPIVGFAIKSDMLDITFTSQRYRNMLMNEWISGLDAGRFCFNDGGYYWKDGFVLHCRAGGIDMASLHTSDLASVHNFAARDSYLRICYQKYPHSFDNIALEDFQCAYANFINETAAKTFKSAILVLQDIDSFADKHKITDPSEARSFKKNLYILMFYREMLNKPEDIMFCRTFPELQEKETDKEILAEAKQVVEDFLKPAPDVKPTRTTPRRHRRR